MSANLLMHRVVWDDWNSPRRCSRKTHATTSVVLNKYAVCEFTITVFDLIKGKHVDLPLVFVVAQILLVLHLLGINGNHLNL